MITEDIRSLLVGQYQMTLPDEYDTYELARAYLYGVQCAMMGTFTLASSGYQMWTPEHDAWQRGFQDKRASSGEWRMPHQHGFICQSDDYFLTNDKGSAVVYFRKEEGSRVVMASLGSLDDFCEQVDDEDLIDKFRSAWSAHEEYWGENK